MPENLHVVCPHCSAVNRIPSAKLGDAPQCGQCKRPLFTGEPLELGSAHFDRHITRSDLPVVVDFWAPWCGPCRTMAPTFHQAALDLEPRARLVKVNTEDNPDLGQRFRIQSIPTLAIFHDSREVTRAVGAQSASAIEALVSRRTYA